MFKMCPRSRFRATTTWATGPRPAAATKSRRPGAHLVVEDVHVLCAPRGAVRLEVDRGPPGVGDVWRSITTSRPAVTEMPWRPLRANTESWIQTRSDQRLSSRRPTYTKSPYT